MKPIAQPPLGAILLLGAGLLLQCAPPPAHAGLGQPVASASTDMAVMHGQLRARSGAGYTVEESTLPSGTVVKEFVSPAGIVFAASWRGPTLPNLEQILGSAYFTQFKAAQKARRFGHSHVQIRGSKFVLHAGGHMRAFYGVAYVPSLVPANVALADLH